MLTRALPLFLCPLFSQSPQRHAQMTPKLELQHLWKVRETATKRSGAADEERTFTLMHTTQSIKFQLFPEAATRMSTAGKTVWRTLMHDSFGGAGLKYVPKGFVLSRQR